MLIFRGKLDVKVILVLFGFGLMLLLDGIILEEKFILMFLDLGEFEKR